MTTEPQPLAPKKAKARQRSAPTKVEPEETPEDTGRYIRSGLYSFHVKGLPE
jgi:hypothetical protein